MSSGRPANSSLGSAKGLFVITGPPGSGKTPILHELVASGFTGVGEPAREVIAEQRATGGDGVADKDPRLFLDLMLSRAVADFRRMSGGPGPVFFDRGIPDQIGYAELFGLDASEAANAAAVYRYNDLVFALPSWPEIYATDSERRMTFEAAEAFGDRVRAIYVELGYSVIDVPCDTVVARTRFILDVLGLIGDRSAAAAVADLRELADTDLLADLAADAESDGHRFVTRLIEEWEDGTNRFSRPGESFYVATVDGRPVGVGGLSIDPYAADAAVGRVRHLYVATSARRLGVGSELVDRILRDARGRFRLVRLRTRNPQAAAFYRARGFAEVDDDEFCTHQLNIDR